MDSGSSIEEYPAPLEWPNWKDNKQEEDWRWSVNKSDFEYHLRNGKDKLNLWGSWTTVLGGQEENVHIGSALVSSDRSIALLSALQTASNPHDYYIPDDGNELEIDEIGFKLKGWVEDQYRENALDEFDPWAGNIRYPPLRPAKFVCDLLQLNSDNEFRVWHSDKEDSISKEIIWSQVWGNCRSKDDESEGDCGRRLQASPIFIEKLLNKMNMDRIVKVEMERSLRRYRYERSTDDGLGYVPPYFRIFIFRSNGRVYSL